LVRERLKAFYNPAQGNALGFERDSPVCALKGQHNYVCPVELQIRKDGKGLVKIVTTYPKQ
jgi:hypothetical protein